jgi:hypothetical protein
MTTNDSPKGLRKRMSNAKQKLVRRPKSKFDSAPQVQSAVLEPNTFQPIRPTSPTPFSQHPAARSCLSSQADDFISPTRNVSYNESLDLQASALQEAYTTSAETDFPQTTSNPQSISTGQSDASEAQITVPLLGTDLWKDALGRLNKEDCKIILAHNFSVNAPLDEILSGLIELAQEKRAYCEDHQWKFEVRGRKINIRNMISGICKGLEKFKQIGDVAAQADPVHVGLPWAGVRFLLVV